MSNATPTLNRDKIETVIFLDIEGVVVTHETIIVNTDLSNGKLYKGNSPFMHRYVDKIAIGLVYKLAVDFKAKIVLTSTLRHLPYTHGCLWACAPTWCKDGAPNLLITETTLRLSKREEEIAEFVARHQVERYVVLDDKYLVCPNFVSVDPTTGFGYREYQEAKRFLAKEESQVSLEAIYL